MSLTKIQHHLTQAMRLRSFQSLRPYSLAVTPFGRYYTASEHRIAWNVIRHTFYHFAIFSLCFLRIEIRNKTIFF